MVGTSNLGSCCMAIDNSEISSSSPLSRSPRSFSRLRAEAEAVLGSWKSCPKSTVFFKWSSFSPLNQAPWKIQGKRYPIHWLIIIFRKTYHLGRAFSVQHRQSSTAPWASRSAANFPASRLAHLEPELSVDVSWINSRGSKKYHRCVIFLAFPS